MIDFWDVSKFYGQKLAVSHLDLHIPGGEVFAFLGPNGAGKTTTIRMLVGLLRPTEGRVAVCGYDTTSPDRLAAQCLGYVPDQPFLYDKLTGREFLEFVGQLRGLSRTELSRRIDRECERFEMHDFLDDLTETYSHGMRQRVVFAAAVLHDPKVIVLDEPTVGLDPKSTKLVKDLLRERAAAGTAVFMSTHTLSIAEEIADRIGIIHRGKLIFVGSVEELRSARTSDHASLEEIFLQLTAEEASGAAPPGSDSTPTPKPGSDGDSFRGLGQGARPDQAEAPSGTSRPAESEASQKAVHDFLITPPTSVTNQ